MLDINSVEQLLNENTNTSTLESDLTGSITQLVAWIVIPSIILSIVVIVILVLYAVRKRKVENAILEIRDLLKEMQESQNNQNIGTSSSKLSIQPTKQNILDKALAQQKLLS